MIGLSLVLMMIAFTIIQGYVFGVAGKYGFQQSISYTDYILKKPFKGLFETVLSTCGAILSTVSIILPGAFIWSLFVAGLCFIGVAIFSNYNKNRLHMIFHSVFAIYGFGLLALTPWIAFGFWYISVITAIMVGLVYIFTPKAVRTWWIELATIYGSFIGLYISLILIFIG